MCDSVAIPASFVYFFKKNWSVTRAKTLCNFYLGYICNAFQTLFRADTLSKKTDQNWLRFPWSKRAPFASVDHCFVDIQSFPRAYVLKILMIEIDVHGKRLTTVDYVVCDKN